jgi:hypothetical protein
VPEDHIFIFPAPFIVAYFQRPICNKFFSQNLLLYRKHVTFDLIHQSSVSCYAVTPSIKQQEAAMKKFCVLFFSSIFVLSLLVTPVFAAGGKNQGAVGQGTVDQGSSGSEDASPGSDAMGNQVN